MRLVTPLFCAITLAALSPAQALLDAPTQAQPHARTQAEPIDDAAVAFFREQGLEHGQVMDHLSWICDVHGPRLTGSSNLLRAQHWAIETLTRWGFDHPRLEEWGPFGRGWELEHFSAAVVGDNPWLVHAVPKAWSSGLPGRVVADVVHVGDASAETLDALDLEGKIVMVEGPRAVTEPFDGPAQRFDSEQMLALADDRPPPARGGDPRAAFGAMDWRRRTEVLNRVYAKRPLAILDRGPKGDYGTIFATGASIPSEPGTPRDQRKRASDLDAGEVIPQITLAVEHYNRICRLLKLGRDVRIALELRVRYLDDDPMERNVLAEIPGSDLELGSEVVMIGAHFDSWHTGTGATDNGCGSAVVLEAARLLSTFTAQHGAPRRTIRIALWSGEEQGLRGSRAWVEQQLGEPEGERARISGYFNLDNGTGRIRGVYLQGNESVAPIFRAWLRPFWDLDATTLTIGDTGGTDHLAFDRVGVPGFQFIQDPVAYSTRTHHSNMDNWDHAVEDDLAQAAVIMASFAWHTAQRDEMLPRKAAPVETPAGTR